MRPAAAGAFFPGGPRCGCVSLGVIGSLHCSSLTVGMLPGPPALPFLLSAGCLFVLGNISLWLGFGLCLKILFVPCGCPCTYCGPHCGRESARVVASLIGSSPSGVRHLSRVCSSVWGPVGVARPFHPSLILGGVLVRLCGGPS